MAIKVDYIIGVSKGKFPSKNDDGKTLKVLNLLNVDQEDKKVLIQKEYGGVVRPMNDTTFALTFSTKNPENLHDPKTEKLVKAYKYLKATQKYELPPLRGMLDEMIGAEFEKLSKGEAEKIKQDADALWLEFMQRIKDPEIQKLLQSIGQYAYVNHAYGWVFCAENIMKIRQQNPNATFLKTEAQWRQQFLRRVRPGTKPIWLVVPVDGIQNSDSQEIANAMSNLGYPPTQRYETLSQQQKHYVDVYIAKRAQKHSWKAYYDIADTIATSNDVWANEPGLKNNLTGELNDIARSEVGDNVQVDDSGKPMDASQLYSESGNIELLYSQLVEGIKAKYSDVQIARTNNIGASYEQTVSNLADYLLETKGKIVNSENRKQGILIATTIVLCLTRVQPESVARKLANNQLTMDDYFDLRNIINEILNTIHRNMTEAINENDVQYLNSVDELLNMMGMNREDVPQHRELAAESKERISVVKESFDKFLNRMKSSTYYNEKFD